MDLFFISRYTPTIPLAVSMMNLFLDNTSARFPLNAALIFQNRSYTYADLSRLTQCLAASLLQRGISPGDRVAFLLPNCLEIVLCYYACFKIGAIAVPLNIRFQPELLKYCLTRSGARVLISEPELSSRIEKIRSSLPGVEQYYLTSSHTTYARPFSELLEANFDSADLPVLDQNCAAAFRLDLPAKSTTRPCEKPRLACCRARGS